MSWTLRKCFFGASLLFLWNGVAFAYMDDLAPASTRGIDALKMAFGGMTKNWGTVNYQTIVYNKEIELVVVSVDLGSGAVILRLYVYGCDKGMCRMMAGTASSQFVTGFLRDGKTKDEKELVLKAATGEIFSVFRVAGNDLHNLYLSK